MLKEQYIPRLMENLPNNLSALDKKSWFQKTVTDLLLEIPENGISVVSDFLAVSDSLQKGVTKDEILDLPY